MKQTNPRDWLFFAESDLKIAKEAMKESIFHIACFHSQQAIEKCLKAVVSLQRKLIPRTHKLSDLWQKVGKPNEIWPNIDISSLYIIDRYYSSSRYPDVLPGSLPEGLPNAKDAREAQSIAQEIYDNLVKYIKKAANS